MPADRLSFPALGTTCHLFGRARGAFGLPAARAWVEAMQCRLTRFEASSELARLNAAGGRWTEVSPELEGLLRASLTAYELSGGLVNVAVLGSMLAIGYTRPLAAGPTPPLLEAARPLPPLADVLEVEAGRARLRGGAGIDLGGVAKGWLARPPCEAPGGGCLGNLGG